MGHGLGQPGGERHVVTVAGHRPPRDQGPPQEADLVLGPGAVQGLRGADDDVQLRGGEVQGWSRGDVWSLQQLLPQTQHFGDQIRTWILSILIKIHYELLIAVKKDIYSPG